MGEARGTDTAPVWPVGAIRDEVDGHFTLGCFDGAVSLARRDRVTLAEELDGTRVSKHVSRPLDAGEVYLEVVNQTLHALLHHCSRWRSELVVIDLDNACRHLVQALRDDAERFSHLLDTAEVPVVAVAIPANWDIELDLTEYKTGVSQVAMQKRTSAYLS
jgi:hypothetical protein